MSHDGPLSGDVPVMPQPWSPQVKGWFNTAGYKGPARPPKNPNERVAPEVIEAAAVLAARRMTEYGSWVEPAAVAPRKRSRS